jgi:hypothetical protein
MQRDTRQRIERAKNAAGVTEQQPAARWEEPPGWMVYDLPHMIEPTNGDWSTVTEEQYRAGLRQVYGPGVTDEEAAAAWACCQQLAAGTHPAQIAAKAEWQARQKPKKVEPVNAP